MLTNILQLASPSLPVGAYTYSEGLETLIEQAIITDQDCLSFWLVQELKTGTIRMESALMVRAFMNAKNYDIIQLKYWNSWLTATRETEELRLQSLQMGGSLIKLLSCLQPELKPLFEQLGNSCNYAIAFGLASYYLKIDLSSAIIAYIHSWLSNLINAGVRLIPLGQTSGQQILFNLQNDIIIIAEEVKNLTDDDLSCMSWGLSLASMQHETQYTRLFRS
jgi:urease accessory protein